MSYKVLLVDDELVDLEWLKRRVTWADFDFEVAATANSGFTALRILKEQHIDILISDIRMPIMSGLELAQKARQLSPNIKIVFISGHEDFSYAKQAISLNAIDYVLKPVKDDELVEMLQSLRKVLDKEAEELKGESRFKDAVDLLKDNMVHQWLSGNDKSINYEILEHYGIVKKNSTSTVALVEVDDVNWKLNYQDKDEKTMVLKKCTDLIIDYINYEQLGYYYCNDERKIVILLKEFEPAVLNYLLQKLIDKIKINTPLTITIGLGCFCDSIDNLPNSYKNAKEAIEYKMFLGKSRIIVYENIPKGELENPVSLDEKIKPIFDAIAEYNLIKLNDSIEDLFNNVKGLNRKKAVFNFTLHLISKLDIEFQKHGDEVKSIFEGQIKNFDLIQSFETVDDIKDWLMKKLSNLVDQLGVQNEKKDRKIIEDIKIYVQKHVEDKITLKDVADYFSFSPNYLGHLFKEATNENFSEFLIRMRMERACQYLLDPKMKIYEICDRVGYKNILYFNRQFKDVYEMTPTDYRKRNKV